MYFLMEWVLGLSPGRGGGMQRTLEAKPLAPCSATVKNEWSHTVMSPYAFMACMGTALSLL